MELFKKISAFPYFKKEFDKWDAEEHIIDTERAYWCLRKPGSEFQKVCLYRDGYTMLIYGDYGCYTFSNMTWYGDVYNLKYNSLGYQTEKLDYYSKQTLYDFKYKECINDIIDWLEDYLTSTEETDESVTKNVMQYVKDSIVGTKPFDGTIDDFCEEHDIEHLAPVIEFTEDCLENCDSQEELVAHLMNSNLDDYDEASESTLWYAGERVRQQYYISLYALYVCGQKLESMFNKKVK